MAPLAHPDSYSLPVTYGQVGPHLIRAGAIDYDAFLAIYERGGAVLSNGQKAILSSGSEEAVSINLNNARFLLNFFWAAGLANSSAILRTGPMVSNDNDSGVEGYASTGGWTLTTKPLHMVYSDRPSQRSQRGNRRYLKRWRLSTAPAATTLQPSPTATTVWPCSA